MQHYFYWKQKAQTRGWVIFILVSVLMVSLLCHELSLELTFGLKDKNDSLVKQNHELDSLYKDCLK
jgi:hypothetical protein